MQLATHASVIMARFDDARKNEEHEPNDSAGALFLKCGSDVRAAGTKAELQVAYKFALLGLHDSLESANQVLDSYQNLCPWMSEAKEIWGASLKPVRQFGEANFLDPANPGPQFRDLAPEPPAGTPLLIMTSAGWRRGPDFDLNRVKEFGEGVTAVRIAMTGVPGLHSQQSFSFPGMLETDGITLTIWQDFASARDFIYGSGVHRDKLTQHRKDPLSDRTSFTRFLPVRSFGTWHGSDPLAW